MYIIINKKNGAPLSRLIHNGTDRRPVAVRKEEVPCDEKGLVCMIDVLKVMGYEIEGYQTAILPKTGLMSRESRYNLDDLKMIHLDSDSGVIS